VRTPDEFAAALDRSLGRAALIEIDVS
jgi:hypothetical protein